MLTQAQLTCLKEAARERGCSANEAYRPTAKLTELGLVTKHPQQLSAPIFKITIAGRETLAILSAEGN